MKKILKKSIIVILIALAIICIFNLMFKSGYVQAADDEFEKITANDKNNNVTWIDILDGIAGIILYIPKAMLYALVCLVQVLINGMAAIFTGAQIR